MLTPPASLQRPINVSVHTVSGTALGNELSSHSLDTSPQAQPQSLCHADSKEIVVELVDTSPQAQPQSLCPGNVSYPHIPWTHLHKLNHNLFVMQMAVIIHWVVVC